MSRLASFAIVVAATFGLAACGEFGSDSSAATPPDLDGGTPTPDGSPPPVGGVATRGITVTAGEAGKTAFVMQSKTTTVPIKLDRRSASVGPVLITVTGLPKDVTVDLLTIAANAVDGTLTLHAASTTPQGALSLDLTAVEQVPNGASATAKLAAFVRGLPGTLDATFGVGGIIKQVFGGSGLVGDARVLKSGAIVVSGQSSNTHALVRFTSAGTLDTTFGAGTGRSSLGGGQGTVFLDVLEGATAADSYIAALAAGTTAPKALRAKFDGQLDTTFGGTGQVLFAGGPGFGNGVDTIALPDGSALVLSLYVQTTKAVIVSRLKANGAVETSYGNNGSCLLDGTGTGSEVASTSRMLPGANGAVRIALALANGTGALKGCTASGTLDTAVGTAPDYFKVVPAGGALAYFDGGLVFRGSSSWSRVNAAYIQDKTIGSVGLVSTAPEIAAANALVAQADGAVIVAGQSAGGNGVTLIRFLQNSTRDQSFGTAGVATIAIATNNAALTGMVAQPDGRLLLLGGQQDNFDGFIARIWP